MIYFFEIYILEIK